MKSIMTTINQSNAERNLGFALYFKVLILTTLVFILNFVTGYSQSASSDLEAGRNGNVSTPLSPITWGNGNSGTSNSHYLC